MTAIHFRRIHKAIALVTDSYSPYFAMALDRAIPQQHITRNNEYGCWEVDLSHESELLWCIESYYGLRSICVNCIDRTCPMFDAIIRMNATNSANQDRAIRQSLSDDMRKFVNEQNRRLVVTSSSTELGMPVVQQSKRRRGKKSDAAELLGIVLPASRTEIMEAFRMATLKAHPDRRGGSESAMLLVLQAREDLLGR